MPKAYLLWKLRLEYLWEGVSRNYERFLCTASTPWDKDKGPSIHIDAVLQPVVCDYYDRYLCPYCGLYFKVTIAD